MPAAASTLGNAAITVVGKVFASLGIASDGNNFAGYLFVVLFIALGIFITVQTSRTIWRYAKRARAGDWSIGNDEYLVLLFIAFIASFAWLVTR